MRTAFARSQVRPVVTYALIALNVVLFVVTAAQAQSINGNQDSNLFFDLVMFGPFVDAGEPWRLVTSTFLHYGITHVAVNMVSLYLIGRGVEEALGRWKYLAVYLLAGVGGSFAAYLFTYDAAVAGASGSVFGLFGAIGVIMLRNKQSLQPLLAILGVNVVISLMPGISLAAHAGGLLVGAASTLALLHLKRS